MKRQPTYEQLMGQKLNSLPPPDITGLWGNMEVILDREMPQQKKKRFGTWWFSANMLIAAGLFASVGTVYTLCRVAGKVPVTAMVNEVSSPEATATPSIGASASTVQQTRSTRQRFSPGLPSTVALTEPPMLLAAAGQPEKEGTDAIELNTTAGSDCRPHPPVEAEGTAASVAEEVLECILTEKLPVRSLFKQQPAPVPFATKMVITKQKKEEAYSDKGLAAGFSLNLPVALGQQQKLALGHAGKKNAWQDYVPSVYAQLHLNRAFYLQAEWQPVMAQYTPNVTLYNRIDELNPDEKMQKAVKLNKLFYTSLPVSFHYNTPVKNLTLGVGTQYSRLKTIILQDQEYYHLIGNSGVFDVTELKNEVVPKNPEAVRGHNTGDVADSLGRSFKRHEWRLLADVGYHFKGFNLGVRYTQGLTNYVNFTSLPVRDRNERLQLYLRLDVFDSRKK